MIAKIGKQVPVQALNGVWNRATPGAAAAGPKALPIPAHAMPAASARPSFTPTRRPYLVQARHTDGRWHGERVDL